MTKGILIFYLSPEDEDGLLVTSEEDPNGRYTRVLRESHSWDPNWKPKVGERLKKFENVGQWERKVIPDVWVAVSFETFEPPEYSQEFKSIVIAHCERQPLTPEEVEEQSYIVPVKRPAMV